MQKKKYLDNISLITIAIIFFIITIFLLVYSSSWLCGNSEVTHSQNFTNLTMEVQESSSNSYNYVIKFDINNFTEENKEFEKIRIKLSNSNNNNSETLKLNPIILSPNTSETHNLAINKSNYYDIVEVVSENVWGLESEITFQINKEDSLKMTILILEILFTILFISLIIMYFILVKFQNKSCIIVYISIICVLAAMGIVICRLKQQDVVECILSLLPFFAIPIFSIKDFINKK